MFSSGKEYLTRKQLRNEVMDEVLSHGGRVGMVELSTTLGVDMNHIEATVAAVLKEDRSLMRINDQLITE